LSSLTGAHRQSSAEFHKAEEMANGEVDSRTSERDTRRLFKPLNDKLIPGEDAIAR
jgi:hypothetical protein